MRDDRQRLQDIVEAIERIQKYASRGRAAFDSDELIQNWVVSHLQIIGELAGRCLRKSVNSTVKCSGTRLSG